MWFQKSGFLSDAHRKKVLNHSQSIQDYLTVFSVLNCAFLDLEEGIGMEKG